MYVMGTQKVSQVFSSPKIDWGSIDMSETSASPSGIAILASVNAGKCSFDSPNTKVFANINVEHSGRSPPFFFREWTKVRLFRLIQKFLQRLLLNTVVDLLLGFSGSGRRLVCPA
jgi:hypothetical protein